jgi:hypothetical protein
MNHPMMQPPTPRQKLHAVLAAAFRTFSASSDRELAREAMRLEGDVLELVNPTTATAKKKTAKRRAQTNVNHA